MYNLDYKGPTEEGYVGASIALQGIVTFTFNTHMTAKL